jgi:hypothetical protein
MVVTAFLNGLEGDEAADETAEVLPDEDDETDEGDGDGMSGPRFFLPTSVEAFFTGVFGRAFLPLFMFC